MGQNNTVDITSGLTPKESIASKIPGVLREAALGGITGFTGIDENSTAKDISTIPGFKQMITHPLNSAGLIGSSLKDAAVEASNKSQADLAEDAPEGAKQYSSAMHALSGVPGLGGFINAGEEIGKGYDEGDAEKTAHGVGSAAGQLATLGLARKAKAPTIKVEGEVIPPPTSLPASRLREPITIDAGLTPAEKPQPKALPAVSSQTVHDIAAAHDENGGTTYNLHKGNLADSNHYAVSMFPERTEAVAGKLTPEIIKSYITRNMDILKDPRASFGSWVGKDGKTYLDISGTTPNLANAYETAKTHNQQSIFDLQHKKEIPTGGTGGITDAPDGSPEIQTAANAYNAENGLLPTRGSYLKVDPRAKEIASAYEKLVHSPEEPATKASYNALISDINKQWDFAQNKMGIHFEPWTGEGQPYKNSADMMADVEKNKHLYFFQGGDMPVNHPLAAVDKNTGLTFNDKLRAVHDVFGHAKNGLQFGPRGEENAWFQHSQMFSPQALPALTTETRGQNSWVNFGPQSVGADGQSLPASQRPFAEQKAGLLPEEYTHRGEGDRLSQLDNGPQKVPFSGRHYSDTNISGDYLEGNRRGMIQNDGRPAGEEAARLEAGRGAPHGVYVYEDAARGEPTILSRRYQYKVQGNKALADIATNPVYHEAFERTVQQALASGKNDTIAMHEGINEAEHALQAAGYDGYYSGNRKGTVFLFGDQKIVRPENTPARAKAAVAGVAAPDSSPKALPAPPKNPRLETGVIGSSQIHSELAEDEAKYKRLDVNSIPKDKIFYHGTGVDEFNDIRNADPVNVGRAGNNLYGPGLYLTDSPSVANSYSGRGRGIVHSTKLGEGVKLIDLEQSLPPKAAEIFQKAFDDMSGGPSDINSDEKDIIKNEKGRNAYDELRNQISDNMLTREDADEITHELAMNLHQAGYDGFAYKGGVRTDGINHNVVVLFPNSDYGIDGEPPLPDKAIANSKKEVAARSQLTPAEKLQISSTVGGKQFVKHVMSLPPVGEFINAAKAGASGINWYDNSEKAFDAMREAAPDYFHEGDKKKFANVVASTSPHQSVQENLKEAIDVWKQWVDAGRPVDPAEISNAVRPNSLATTKLPNLIRSFNNLSLMEGRKDNFKVPNFGENLAGNTAAVTNDTHMADYAGVNVKTLQHAPLYNAMTAHVRSAADALGIEPRQAQAAIWTFKTVLSHVLEGSGTDARPWQMVGKITPEDFAEYNKDISHLLLNDPEVRTAMKDKLGVDLDEFDKKAKAKLATVQPTLITPAEQKAALERLGSVANRLAAGKNKPKKAPSVTDTPF